MLSPSPSASMVRLSGAIDCIEIPVARDANRVFQRDANDGDGPGVDGPEPVQEVEG